MDRQQFIQLIGGVPFLSRLLPRENHHPEPGGVRDEEFWINVRDQFEFDSRFLDFRCHAASVLPSGVLENLINTLREVQRFPSYRNHETAHGDKSNLRVLLAKALNCSTSEVAIFRNTTEALNNALMGFPFQRGDEVVASVHEYDSMISSLHQQQKMAGISVRQIEIPYRPESPEQIVNLFKQSITPKTKMFLISHMVWISGQIYPVKEICELAKAHNIVTVIDAAQSFFHIPIDVQSIGCDYLGSSLHKWTAAPLGTGFLYIRKKNIPITSPLMGHYEYKADDDVIEKFENLGSTTPVLNIAAASIEFWDKIGFDVKRERMHELKQYWTEKLAGLPKISILTNTETNASCGLAYFQVNGRSSREIGKILMEKHNIWTHVVEGYKNHYVDYKGVNAVGIATPVFVTKKEIDKFVDAIIGLTK